jgi:tetratricopeptide (TPR) repeat protein
MFRFCIVAFCLSWFCSVSTTAADPWVGKTVFWKDGATAKLGSRNVDIELVPHPAVVEQVEGEWLWLGLAWVHNADVLLAEEALNYYSEQIQRAPSSPSSWNGRASVWRAKGELDKALADYNEAIRLDPQNPLAYSNRAMVWSDKGQHEKALKDYTKAIQLDSNRAAPFSNRGTVWLDTGEIENAICDFTEAIRLDSEVAANYSNRGTAWLAKGEVGQAIEDYEVALQINRTCHSAHVGLAWILSTSVNEEFRDGIRALQHATQACELTRWADANTLANLAAAHAESGDFENAVKWHAKALELYEEQERKRWTSVLDLYKSGKPYRDDPMARPDDLLKAK